MKNREIKWTSRNNGNTVYDCQTPRSVRKLAQTLGKITPINSY